MVCLIFAAPVPTSCQRPAAEPVKGAVGHHDTRLGVSVGSIWGGGYSIDVAPEEYVVVEHANCPDAKDVRATKREAKGLCVVRITAEQSARFEAAMKRFKRNAVPLQSFSVDSPFARPDGKPCKNEVTDSTLITLQWAGTEGAKIASFYTGCDQDELGQFYRSALAVTDALPIQQIIGER